jgi:hypothetical protein
MEDTLNKKLKTNWVLWFHELNNNEWGIDSYKQITTLSTIGNTLYTLNQFKNLINLDNGMFFIMKEGIHPIWESDDNINGGYWSFKILKHDAYQTWKYLVLSLVGMVLTTNIDDMACINGITSSPKENNCIFKICNNDSSKNNVSMLTTEIPNLMSDVSRYTVHRRSRYLQ